MRSSSSGGNSEKSNDPTDKSSDTEAPILQEIHFLPPEIQDGGESGVFATVTDDLSGVRSVSGSLRSPNSGASVGFSMRRQGQTDTWAARIAMPMHAEEGTWVITQLRLQDNANNVRWINWSTSNAPASARLKVSSAEADSTPPTILSITMAKPSVGKGESNTILVQAQDDNSGVASVYGMFSSPNGTASQSFHCNAPASGNTWSGTVTPPSNADCGEWKLRYIAASDKANNRVTLNANDPRVQAVSFFLAFSGDCDSTPPAVTMVTITPSAVDNSRANTLTAQAFVTDDASGVRGLSGRVSGPIVANGQPPSINFGFQPGPNPSSPWTATFVVPQYSAKGHWTFQSLIAIDKANNRRVYTPSDPVLASTGFDVN